MSRILRSGILLIQKLAEHFGKVDLMLLCRASSPDGPIYWRLNLGHIRLTAVTAFLKLTKCETIEAKALSLVSALACLNTYVAWHRIM